MKSYPLAEGCIEVSPEREAYNSLRIKYLMLAENAKSEFSSQYDQRFKNIDQLHTDFLPVALSYIEKAVDVSIRDLIAHNVNDINDFLFSEVYLAPHLTLDGDFSRVVGDKYLTIGLSRKDLDERKNNKQGNGPSVIGGGFGVEGALQGAAVATAANVAIGVVSGLANATGKALGNISDNLKKQELFKGKSVKFDLAEFIETFLSFIWPLLMH